MFTIFWRTIKDRRISLIVYCLSGILLLWMYVALFPSILEEAENLNKLIESYPEALMKAFGIKDFTFDHIENFLAVEQFSIVWPLIVIFMMIAIAGRAISGEIEKGTAEILLSKPVSRLKIFFGKYLAGFFTLLVFTIFTIFAIVPLAELHNIDYVLENYFSLAIIAFLFAWALFSMAMFFSAIFSERSKAYMATGGILIAMYVLNIIAALKDNLSDLKYASFFYYYNYSDALIRNTIDDISIWVFLGVIVVFTVVGAIWFKKRDIAV